MAGLLRFHLKKADRLLKRSEFTVLSSQGRKIPGRLFIALVAPSACGRSRLGVTVSRKVGNAVQRNRIKRLAREYFRINRHELTGHWDINLIARSGAAAECNQAVFQALAALFREISRQIEQQKPDHGSV